MADPKDSPTKDTPAETPREAFVRLAQRRAGAVITALGSLEQLVRPANYEYTPEDWTKINQAIEAARAKCMTAAQTGKVVKDAGFTL
jgi:hypothetical protein